MKTEKNIISITDQIGEYLKVNDQLKWEKSQVILKVDELLEQNQEERLKEYYTSYLKENSSKDKVEKLININWYSLKSKKMLFLDLLDEKIKNEWNLDVTLYSEVIKLLKIDGNDKKNIDLDTRKRKSFTKMYKEWRPNFLWWEIEEEYVWSESNPNFFQINDNEVYMANFNRELFKLINDSLDMIIWRTQKEWLNPDKKELMKDFTNNLISNANVKLENEEFYTLYNNWINNWIMSSLNWSEIDWYKVSMKSFTNIFFKNSIKNWIIWTWSDWSETYRYITALDKEWNEKRAVIGEDKKLYFNWSDEFSRQLKDDKYKYIVNGKSDHVWRW